LANLYTTEAVQFTQRLQSNAAHEVRQFVGPQLAQVETEIADLKNEKLSLPKALPSSVASRPTPLMLKLQKAQEELVDALTQYMDTHPVVQAARAKLESLEQQIAKGEEVPALPSEAEVAGQFALQRDAWDMLRSELQPLETARHELIKRQRAAEVVAGQPPGYYRILSPALLRDVKGTKREFKIAAVTVFFGFAGFVSFALLAMFIEVMDNRLKSQADVTRVTGLPVMAGAPDLGKLTHIEQRNWAFRTWKQLQGRLSPTLNHGLVCGVTSAANGEGRSTLIRNLARAASESGFRVLTVSTRHESSNGEAREANRTNGHGLPAVSAINSLPTPVEVEHKLVGPHSQRVVHIPLPGWAWNLERRKQWQCALEQWRTIDNVVILVELPPACLPEAILLAEEIPNVIWLSDSGSSSAAETRAHLETLRSARCNLVGAILNHAPTDRTRRRLARWLPCILMALVSNVCNAQSEMAAAAPSTPQAQTVQPPQNAQSVPESAPPAAGRFLGSSTPAERAPWQERFTLGPGDVLRIALYGSPEFTKAAVVVAPDGRVGFLEAHDVLANGRTIDEFREALDQALANFRRAPRTMVTPVTFKSKKYCVLGKVNQRGVYSLDHPTTILEAIARAKGFEVGLRDRDSIDLVDLQRSFLMRDGKRLSVNFERMFLDGDLSQNISLAPGDYLFFPSTGLREVHVLGDVRYPGSLTYSPGLGVIGAIAQRAGFNEKSYKSHVLVVRGSLDNPQTFVVNCNAILGGETPDFQLQPKDIVYVSKRPWWRAEELLDLAISAFLQSIVASYVGQDIVQPINP
jgi:protein involved in polysaccharide export with SLBB domain